MRASFIIHKFEKVIVSIFNNTLYLTELQVNFASGPGFFASHVSRSLLAPVALAGVYLLRLVPAFSRHQPQQVFYTENVALLALVRAFVAGTNLNKYFIQKMLRSWLLCARLWRAPTSTSILYRKCRF